MAQTGLRVRIGDDVRYLEATDDKPSIAYARLAEPRWERDDAGNFTELESEWHNGVFRGRQAELIREHQKGDSLLVLGNISEYEKTGNDGTVYQNVDLNVNHFAPDLSDRAVTVNYDRSKRQSREQRQTSEQNQEADITAAPVNQAAAGGIPIETVNAIDNEIHSRLQQLVDAGRLDPESAQETFSAISMVPESVTPATYCKIAEHVTQRRLPPAEAAWVGHTPRAILNNQTPPTWQQAQAAVPQQNQQQQAPQPQQSASMAM